MKERHRITKAGMTIMPMVHIFCSHGLSADLLTPPPPPPHAAADGCTGPLQLKRRAGNADRQTIKQARRQLVAMAETRLVQSCVISRCYHVHDERYCLRHGWPVQHVHCHNRFRHLYRALLSFSSNMRHPTSTIHHPPSTLSTQKKLETLFTFTSPCPAKSPSSALPQSRRPRPRSGSQSRSVWSPWRGR